MATELTRSTSTSVTNLGDDKEKGYLDSPALVTPALDPEKGSLNTSDPEADPNTPVRPYGKFKWFLICIAVYSTAFLYGLDNTIVADIQASAVETFGSVEKLGWLGIGFPLGSIATILSIGKAYGTFDVKWIYIVSIIMFEGGSTLCGAAPNMNALIIGRVWAGAGGAGMYLGVLNLLAINTSLRERPMYMAICGLTWGLGCILGPVIGGSFADSSATWRWAFYINLVLFAIFIPVYFFVLGSYQPQPNVALKEKIKTMDWLGVILNAGLYISFVMIFTFGGTLWAWGSGRTIATIVIFAVILIAFCITQAYSICTTPEWRLFPGDFLRSRTLVLNYVAISAQATGLFVPVYYIPLYFSFVHGDTGLEAAVRLLPFICFVIFGALLNGQFLPKWGYYWPWYVVSGVCILLGGSLMYAAVDVNTPNAHIYGFSIILGLGAGISQNTAYSVAPAKVPPHRVSDSIGFINAAQLGAIVIALTITSTVFQNVGFSNVQQALEGLYFSEGDIRAALAGAKSEVFTSISPEVREKVMEGIVEAIGNGYILVIVAGVISLICAALMKREKLFMEASAGG
ncbi:MFS general substrate transporter [Tothia fuscella]|uniref:MFS general substrate transporter n=1 Tax=Tothia fuscella TaxID=1048955 RepID=A0A9P4U064_9PEZI|nr:MFS general substrate transporter [Tothia fuscella]